MGDGTQERGSNPRRSLSTTMMNSALRPDASLPEVLAARARAMPDGRLVAGLDVLLATWIS